MKLTNPKGRTGRFTLCPGYSLLNFLDWRVFSLNDFDVRLDLDSAGSFGLALAMTMARDKNTRSINPFNLPFTVISNLKSRPIAYRKLTLISLLPLLLHQL